MADETPDDSGDGLDFDSIEKELQSELAPSRNRTGAAARHELEEPVDVGPFRLDDLLGAGGTAVVYGGEHRQTEVPVAAKIVRRSTDADTRRRFHEEVQAHAGLVHPGIVYLFEYGEVERSADDSPKNGALSDGKLYVAMERADEGTLRDMLPIREWAPLRRLVVHVLDALAYAHARGVIHRDLKPENLLIFDASDDAPGDWRVKVADFGIAHALGEEDVAETARLHVPIGTPTYMAPEQFRGEWRRYGPWTDLYAIGCIVWELACGRPPFEGDSYRQLVEIHQERERPALDPQFPVPEGLEEWIHRCIAVAPKERFRRAADALYHLPGEALAGSSSSPGREADRRRGSRTQQLPTLGTTRLVDGRESVALETTLEDSEGHIEAESSPGRTHLGSADLQRPPVPESWRPGERGPVAAPLVGTGLGLFGLREPPFVNRYEECDRVWEAVRDVADDGAFRMVFVAGEAGTGKSRLVEWITARADEVGAARILRATHTSSGGRHAGLRGALDRELRTLKMSRGEVFAYLREALPPLEDWEEEWRERDARALTEYLRPTDDESEQMEGPRYRFSSADQKRGLIVRTLRRLSRDRPTVLWLDDLQWGGEAVGLLEHLAQMTRQPPPLAVVATVRSDLLREDERLRERLEELEETASAIHLPLEPLSGVHQRSLLEGLLPLENELADHVAERTEGHPLFAMQLIAHWIDVGALEVGADGFRITDDQVAALPEDIHALWLERIDEWARSFVDAEAAALKALERAAALGREIDEAEWRAVCDPLAIRHPEMLRSRLIERGLATRTESGWEFTHGLLVESLERRAREDDRWGTHHRRCVEILETVYPDRPDVTAGRRARHLEHAGELEEAIDWRWREYEFLRRRGDMQGALDALDRRRTLLESIGAAEDDERVIEHDVTTALRRLQLGASPDEVWTEVQSVLERADDVESERLLSHAHRVATRAHRMAGRIREALVHARNAVESARSAPENELKSALLQSGWAHYFAGEPETTRERIEEMLEIARDRGDMFDVADGLRILSLVVQSRGERERSERLAERALEICRDHGYRNAEAGILNLLGELARFDDDPQRARRYYSQFEQIIRGSVPESEAVAGLNLACVELMASNFERADERFDEAERELDRIDGKGGWIHHLRLGRLASASGRRDWESFDARFERYAAGWPEDAPLEKDHPWLLEMAGDCAAEAQQPERAREAWRLARRLWKQLDDDAAAERVAAKLDE